MAINISPKAFVKMLTIQSAMEAPRVFIGEKLGLLMPQNGWDFIKVRTTKNYEVGFEIRGSLPEFSSASELELLANEGLKLTLQHFGDFLADACIKIREEPLWPDETLRIGHYINMNLDRNYNKFIQIDIVYSKDTNSYAMIAFVYKHIVDAVPVIFLIYQMHNYIILKEKSYISNCKRTPVYSLEKKLNRYHFTPDKEKWDKVLPKINDSFLNVGAQIKIHDSYIRKLRRKLYLETGIPISTSSLELALIGIETGLNYASDCVAVGYNIINDKVDISSGYKRLGHVVTTGYEKVIELSAEEQYKWLINILKVSSDEMNATLNGGGKSANIFAKLRNIPDYARIATDKWSTYDCLMEVAGSQLLGTNLNGVDYGVSLAIGNIKPGDIRGIGIPSNPEHSDKIKEIRRKKGINEDITEFAFAHGQLIKGTDFVYKSIKTNRKVALKILGKWGFTDNDLFNFNTKDIIIKVYDLMYSPKNPLEGRIEQLALKYLNININSKN